MARCIPGGRAPQNTSIQQNSPARGAKEPQKKRSKSSTRWSCDFIFLGSQLLARGGPGSWEAPGAPLGAAGLPQQLWRAWGEERGLAAELEAASPWLGGCPEVIYG